MAAFALAGCGGGGGYRDAPTIALPPGAALAPEEPRADSPRADPVPEQQQPAPISRYDSPPPAAMPASRGLPPEPAQGEGPRATSGEAHDDAVGYAATMAEPPDARFGSVTIGVAHPTLDPGTLVELTALDTGRTIVAMVVSRYSGDAVVAVSPGTAQALGVGDHAGLRVRTVAASPQDRLALQSGQAASGRLDAPPALLAALRRRLPGRSSPAPARSAARPAASARPAAPARVAAPAIARPVRAPAGARTSGFVVQVVALSSAARAASVAAELGGHVAASGGLYRVQIGPFADMAGAQRARDGAARRGYGDARIFHTD